MLLRLPFDITNYICSFLSMKDIRHVVKVGVYIDSKYHKERAQRIIYIHSLQMTIKRFDVDLDMRVIVVDPCTSQSPHIKYGTVDIICLSEKIASVSIEASHCEVLCKYGAIYSHMPILLPVRLYKRILSRQSMFSDSTFLSHVSQVSNC